MRKSDSDNFINSPERKTRIDAGDLLIALGAESSLANLEKLALVKTG